MLAKAWLWAGLDILIPRIHLVYHLTAAGFILNKVLCIFQIPKQDMTTHAHTHRAETLPEIRGWLSCHSLAVPAAHQAGRCYRSGTG